ncbi:MAG: AAA family ATPase [Candidatus Hodarchaeota archaeon]
MSTQNGIQSIVKEIQEKYNIVGRDKELKIFIIATKAGKNILLEGEIGAGKTTIAKAVADYFDKNFHRVEGTEDLYSTTLIGTWQPPVLIQKGYCDEAFESGPLTLAMMDGGCLFINEINRAPESTQNLLLTALDEKILEIPNLKTLKAKDGFFIIATRNPASHIGVSVLGEALKDRFVWIKLEYQSEEEEREIVKLHTGCDDAKVIEAAVKITRSTRNVKDIRRGSSVRGAIDITLMLMEIEDENIWDSIDVWIDVCISALITKIDLEEGINKSPEEIIKLIVQRVLQQDFFP